MRKLSYFCLALATLACLLISGCGGDDTTAYIPIIKTSGKFVYVNNDAATNYVSAFAINTDGTLEELADSPYATGGLGNEGGYYAANAIALARDKKLLFATNKGEGTISVFSINSSSGALTAIGTPVASGGTMTSSGSMAVDDDENFLFVANSGTNTIAVFAIAADGTLTAVTGSPFDIGTAADGITLNAVGSLLYVAAPNTNSIIVLDVAADGSLSPIAGSPFPYTASGPITSFTLASSTLGLSGAVGGEIASYLIDETGAPTMVESQAIGLNAQCVTTVNDGALAILSGGEDSIYVLSLAADGTMTQVTGSPFATDGLTSGYAVATPNNKFLYATEVYQIEAFGIDSAGALTSLGVYPLSNPGYAMSLTIY